MPNYFFLYCVFVKRKIFLQFNISGLSIFCYRRVVVTHVMAWSFLWIFQRKLYSFVQFPTSVDLLRVDFAKSILETRMQFSYFCFPTAKDGWCVCYFLFVFSPLKLNKCVHEMQTENFHSLWCFVVAHASLFSRNSLFSRFCALCMLMLLRCYLFDYSNSGT